MKGITSNPALDAYQRVAVGPVGQARPADQPVAGADGQASQAAKVTISHQARELAAGAEPQVDAQKVQALKAQVDNGSYAVNPQQIAARMLGIG